MILCLALNCPNSHTVSGMTEYKGLALSSPAFFHRKKWQELFLAVRTSVYVLHKLGKNVNLMNFGSELIHTLPSRDEYPEAL